MWPSVKETPPVKVQLISWEEALKTLSREEMIKRLLWNSGGTGYGLCSVAAALIWEDDRPSETRPDWISIVAIGGPPDKYTDEELAKLVSFSASKTAEYDTMWKWRRGANMICISKEKFSYNEHTSWLRKRMSWTMGPIYSPSLEEALAVMTRN